MLKRIPRLVAALIFSAVLPRIASAELPTLGFRTYSIADGVLTAEVVSPVSGRMVFVSGAADKGDDISAWDRCETIADVVPGGLQSVNVTIPAGDMYARLIVCSVEPEYTHGYKIYEYLQGDGLAYLELDYTLSSADKVEIVAKPTGTTLSPNHQSGVFGARNGASAKNFTMARTVLSEVGTVVVDVNNSNYTSYRLDIQWPVGSKKSFVASANERTADGDGKKNPCPDTFTTDYRCRLFSYAGNMPSSYTNAFEGCIYSFKISTLSSGAVQRDLVAVNLGTDADPIPGMCDQATGAIYTNLSTVAGSAFSLGPMSGEYADAVARGPLMTRTVFVEEPSSSGALIPLESVVAGNAVVDTGVHLRSSDKVGIRFRFNKVGKQMALFGARVPGAGIVSNCFDFTYRILFSTEQVVTNQGWNFAYKVGGRPTIPAKVDTQTEYDASCSAADGMIVNGVQVGEKPAYDNFEVGSTLHLFGMPNTSGSGYVLPADVTFYSADVFWENGTKKAAIRPVLDGSGTYLKIVLFDMAGAAKSAALVQSKSMGYQPLKPPATIFSVSRPTKSKARVEFTSGAPGDVYFVCGRRNGQEDLSKWSTVTKVRSITDADCGKLLTETVSVPPDVAYARFCLVVSSETTWSEPLVYSTGLAIIVR